ncbi:MAG: pyridoxamine 5'-phosphate oxidase [Epsilonproteobacteria bacterium]|nr:pyridoxamine 5'-phosphate oxidase [Campylobacterota bacterium]
MDLSHIRSEYMTKPLHRESLDANPIRQFEYWFNDALEAKLIDPNAMTLATTGDDMLPSVRTVLLKIFDHKGFVFFSNKQSEKAQQISQNPQAALLFTWLSLHRQIKIQGHVEEISKTDSMKYFLSRPKGSQIGAWVSSQSKVIQSRAILEAKFEEIKNKFLKGKIPFPDFWGGYIVKPIKIEFWQGGQNRLHDRFLYTKQQDESWKIERLAP